MLKSPLLIILGATASGKTKLAVQLAHELDGEIISADSRQVFMGMDIGTGKDLSEYHIHNKLIPYHLIDHKQAGETYQVNAFKEDFYQVFQQIIERDKLPILCGGTGMYIHSVLQNHEFTAVPVNLPLREKLEAKGIDHLRSILMDYKAETRRHADLSTVKRLIRAIEIAEYLKYNTIPKMKRPLFNPLVIGLISSIEVRRNKIYIRLEDRLKNGLIEEVESLLHSGVSMEILTFYGLEYKFVLSYLVKEISLIELKDKLFIAICQYAKRQMTFFRKMEKDGVKINWLDVSIVDDLGREAVSLFKAHYSPSN